MHPHLKDARAGHTSKLQRLSGSHGTVANPAGNKSADGEMPGGPQKAVGLGVSGVTGKSRVGKFARGGKVKHGKTNINVIVGGQKEPVPVPVPAPGLGAAPGAMPPRPPMAPPMMPPNAPPPMAPGGGGMPIRKSGGRTFKRGGAVKMDAGAGSGEGRLEKVKAQKGR